MAGLWSSFSLDWKRNIQLQLYFSNRNNLNQVHVLTPLSLRREMSRSSILWRIMLCSWRSFGQIFIGLGLISRPGMALGIQIFSSLSSIPTPSTQYSQQMTLISISLKRLKSIPNARNTFSPASQNLTFKNLTHILSPSLNVTSSMKSSPISLLELTSHTE